MTTSLIGSTRDYLNQQKGKWPQICEDTDLDYSWLSKFAQGKIRSPGAAKIEVLIGYMKKHRPPKQKPAKRR